MSLHQRVATRFRVAQAFLRKAFDTRYTEALLVFGFPPEARPTDDEINIAYRSKVRDLLKENPELGRDQGVLKPLNIAKDVLKQGPTESIDNNPDDSGMGRGVVDIKPPPEEKTTFVEAKNHAKIPSDVKWLFVTDTQHSGYSSDEFTNSTNGWVACGETDAHWVYVTAEHHYYRAYTPGGYFSLNEKQVPKDIWTIKTLKLPKKSPTPVAAELYKGVLKAWQNFEKLEKKFNSKVIPAKDWTFHEKLPTGRLITIKQLVSNETGVEFTGKMTVEVAYREPPRLSDETPAGYYRKSEYNTPYQLELVINGREHVLSVADTEILAKSFRVGGKDFVDRVFGDYAHHSRPKSLSLNRDGKVIMAWMAEKLPHLPDWVREGLTRAATPSTSSTDKKPRRRYSYDRHANG